MSTGANLGVNASKKVDFFFFFGGGGSASHCPLPLGTAPPGSQSPGADFSAHAHACRLLGSPGCSVTAAWSFNVFLMGNTEKQQP